MTHDPALSPVFRAYFADLVEQRSASGVDDPFHDCFGCGPAHPSGLRVRCFRRDGGVVSPIIIARQHEGPPGAAHGGIVAAYLDEVLAGAALACVGRPGVTGELTVRYVKPVPTQTPLLGRARAVADHARYVDVEGALEDFASGAVVARAKGRFFPVDRGVTAEKGTPGP